MKVAEYNDWIAKTPTWACFFKVTSLPNNLKGVLEVGDLIYANPNCHQEKFTLDGETSFAISSQYIEFAGYHIIQYARVKYAKRSR